MLSILVKFNSYKKDSDAFCINGIEIDLKELEELEKRVAAKRQAQSSTSNDYDESNSKNIDSNNCTNDLEESFEKSLKISNNNENVQAATAVNPPSLASMFLVIMSIFAILNQIYYKPTAQS